MKLTMPQLEEWIEIAKITQTKIEMVQGKPTITIPDIDQDSNRYVHAGTYDVDDKNRPLPDISCPIEELQHISILAGRKGRYGAVTHTARTKYDVVRAIKQTQSAHGMYLTKESALAPYTVFMRYDGDNWQLGVSSTENDGFEIIINKQIDIDYVVTRQYAEQLLEAAAQVEVKSLDELLSKLTYVYIK